MISRRWQGRAMPARSLPSTSGARGNPPYRSGDKPLNIRQLRRVADDGGDAAAGDLRPVANRSSAGTRRRRGGKAGGLPLRHEAADFDEGGGVGGKGEGAGAGDLA